MILQNFFKESKNVIANTAKNENGTIYKKDTFDKFIKDIYPESAENGVITPSKYENYAKKARKKLRTFLLQTLESFLAVSDKTKKEKFAKEFSDFYKEFYKVNDYSVNSVTNGKLKTESLQIVATALQELKAMNENTTKAMNENTTKEKKEKTNKQK